MNQDLFQGDTGWRVGLRSEFWQTPPSTIIWLLIRGGWQVHKYPKWSKFCPGMLLVNWRDSVPRRCAGQLRQPTQPAAPGGHLSFLSPSPWPVTAAPAGSLSIRLSFPSSEGLPQAGLSHLGPEARLERIQVVRELGREKSLL